VNTPRSGAEVTMNVPQRERVAARITGTGPGWLDLGLVQSVQTPERQLERMRVFVEYVNDDGICRLVGSVTPPDPDGPRIVREPGVIDTMRFDYKSAPQLLQRREFIRTDVSCDLHLCRMDAGSLGIAAKTVNVSGGGLLARGVGTASIGELFTFELHLFRGDVPISGTCRIMRITGDGLAGVMFTQINPIEQDRIVRWAFGVAQAEKSDKAA
jgi:PilZ domain